MKHNSTLLDSLKMKASYTEARLYIFWYICGYCLLCNSM